MNNYRSELQFENSQYLFQFFLAQNTLFKFTFVTTNFTLKIILNFNDDLFL